MFDPMSWSVLLVGFPLGLAWGVPLGLKFFRRDYNWKLTQASWNKKGKAVVHVP